MPRAAVCTELNAPLDVLDLSLEGPGEGEVLIDIRASGICASDTGVQSGALPSPFPIVLGHEAAGVVAGVGAGVTRMKEGDHVVIAGSPQCGDCKRCRRDQAHLCERGEQVLRSGTLPDGSLRFSNGSGGVHQMVAAGTFAEAVVVSQISAVPIPEEMPLKPAALIGCGVLTGAGAAMNTADIRPGDTVAVIGLGTVGLSALMGALAVGAERVIALDIVPAKLAVAEALGATDTLDPAAGDPVAAVRELVGRRGVDVVLECVGAEMTIDQAIRMTDKGGEVVFVGAAKPGVKIDVEQFTGLVGPAKTFKGCLFGSADIHRDVPRIVDGYSKGRFELDRLVTDTFTLDEINTGLAALGVAESISGVVEFD